MLFSALWKNQCWICHRIRCITKFFTEFGAEKCTFSFTGGYSAHTSFNALLTCQKVSLKNNFLTCKISRLISIVLIKDSFVPTDCCLAQYEKWDRLKLFDTSLFGETILFNWLMYIFNYKRITSKLQRTLLTKRGEESKAQLGTSTISAFAQLSYVFPLSPP